MPRRVKAPSIALEYNSIRIRVCVVFKTFLGSREEDEVGGFFVFSRMRDYFRLGYVR